MLKPARIIGFAAIVLTAFGTAAAIAAIGGSDNMTVAQIVPAETVAAAPSTACEISFMAADAAPNGIQLTVNSNDSTDLDISDMDGVSLACGAGGGAAASVDVTDAPVEKADQAAF